MVEEGGVTRVEAPCEVLYHGSRPDHRESILREGLRPGVPEMASDNASGVYLTADFDEALSYGSGEPANPEIADVWEVEVLDLDLYRDGIDWASYFTATAIGPERLKLVHAGTTTWAEWQRVEDAAEERWERRYLG